MSVWKIPKITIKRPGIANFYQQEQLHLTETFYDVFTTLMWRRFSTLCYVGRKELTILANIFLNTFSWPSTETTTATTANWWRLTCPTVNLYRNRANINTTLCLSWAVWPDGKIIFQFLAFTTMKIWPILTIKIAKVGSKCCQLLTDPKNIAKYF